MKIELTQDELTALTGHMEAMASRYESDAVALFHAKGYPEVRKKALELREKSASVEALLSKLLHL